MIVIILDFNSFAFKGNTLVVKHVYANKNTFFYLCQYKLGSLDYAIGSKNLLQVWVKETLSSLRF